MKAIHVLAISTLTFTSAALAGQPNGRDSYYAESTASFPAARTAAVPAPGNGRASVYASELPAPTPRTQVQVVGEIRPGRA